MIFCFDIDNTICENKSGDMTLNQLLNFFNTLHINLFQKLQCIFFTTNLKLLLIKSKRSALFIKKIEM